MDMVLVCKKGIFNRTSRELLHVWKRSFIIFPKVFFVAYVAQVPFRNVAYFRHEQRETLKDIGFQLISELDEENKWISELIFWLIHIIGPFFLIVPWLTQFAHNNEIYGVVLAERWLDSLCIGHVLRFVTYTSTSLPGPATHCRVGAIEPGLYRPTELSRMFTRKSTGTDGNCGDLIFSGHMYQNMILTLTIASYSHVVVSNRIVRKIFVITMCFLTMAQAPLIIASRNHYTVDIVVATYVAPLVYHFLQTISPIIKHKPNSVEKLDTMLEAV